MSQDALIKNESSRLTTLARPPGNISSERGSPAKFSEGAPAPCNPLGTVWGEVAHRSLPGTPVSGGRVLPAAVVSWRSPLVRNGRSAPVVRTPRGVSRNSDHIGVHIRGGGERQHDLPMPARELPTSVSQRPIGLGGDLMTYPRWPTHVSTLPRGRRQ